MVDVLHPTRHAVVETWANFKRKYKTCKNISGPMGGEVNDLQNKKQMSSEQPVTLITMLSNYTAAGTVTARGGNWQDIQRVHAGSTTQGFYQITSWNKEINHAVADDKRDLKVCFLSNAQKSLVEMILVRWEAAKIPTPPWGCGFIAIIDSFVRSEGTTGSELQ